MPRQVRIEYPGAIYHVMARGDRREAIFHEDEDRLSFLEALGEACGRTGWRVHANALMGNHYHLVVETPEPNLVAGMAWIQNTYTRRFNFRHKLWGHLFGGRYKAMVVHLENRIRTEGSAAGRSVPDGQRLQSTLRRGWYFGSETFRERLLAPAGQKLAAKVRSRNYQRAPEVREHNLGRAHFLVKRGLEVCGLKAHELTALPCKDERKVLIALAVRTETTVALRWIAQSLHMGVPSTVSREVKALRRSLPKKSDWAKLYREIMQST